MIVEEVLPAVGVVSSQLPPVVEMEYETACDALNETTSSSGVVEPSAAARLTEEGMIVTAGGSAVPALNDPPFRVKLWINVSFGPNIQSVTVPVMLVEVMSAGTEVAMLPPGISKKPSSWAGRPAYSVSQKSTQMKSLPETLSLRVIEGGPVQELGASSSSTNSMLLMS